MNPHTSKPLLLNTPSGVRRIVTILLLLLTLPTALAAGLDVDILYDDSADFSAYKTYRWATGPLNDSPDSESVDRRIKTTADALLAKKGLRLVDDDKEPDLLITYYGGMEESLLIEGVRFELAPRVVWTGADPMGVTRRYEVGTLVLDFADAETEKIIWSGVAQAKASTTRQLREKIEKAVQKVLKQYPPQ